MTPYEIGANIYRKGLGISDLWGAVSHDSEMAEAQRGYDDAQMGIKMDESSNNQVMDILQEEAAEVIQAVSKIRRFGWESKHPESQQTNLEHLEEELGDMLAMIDILMVNNVVSWSNLHAAKRAKIEKLKKWSDIQNLDKI
jgi:NTP pyrophosphatase (non-canonical NTP hydrolase)